MKIINYILIHPHISNLRRTEVLNWCMKEFGEYNNDIWRWNITSNYDRSDDGTFDIYFKNRVDAQWFLIRFGGEVIEINYDGTDIEQETFNTLFDEA